VFRRVEEDKAVSLVATVEANQWLDTTTEYGKQYHYIIRRFKKPAAGEVESDLSAEQTVTKDEFPPAVPRV